MANVALVPLQAAPPRYADAAAIFLAEGIPPSALRERAAADPEFSDLLHGVAGAMDALAPPGGGTA